MRWSKVKVNHYLKERKDDAIGVDAVIELGLKDYLRFEKNDGVRVSGLIVENVDAQNYYIEYDGEAWDFVFDYNEKAKAFQVTYIFKYTK